MLTQRASVRATPSKEIDADTLFDGNEWLTMDEIQYYRKPDSNDEWKTWEE